MRIVHGEQLGCDAPNIMDARARDRATRRNKVSGASVSSPIRGPHDALLEPAFALMARGWQRERILLGDHGNFDNAARRARDSVAVDLRHGSQPSLAKVNDSRITLSYDPGAYDPGSFDSKTNDPGASPALAAQGDVASAFIAAAACSGESAWPIARDNQSLALLTLAERIAASDIPVLLEGPTGTGKEVFARFMHRVSARADGPFIAVNCAAMPEAMLEGLLFGHRKGAFTGAAETREGLFRAAHGGTLLLDEIGELPLALQSKLLRTLQEGEVLPLGSTAPVKVDVRIIAATNRVLATEVEAGRFREDLLYRLNVFPLSLSPLCERRGDIAPLAFGMLLRHACRDGGPGWIARDALSMIEAHNWPGNVRELENVVRRAILLAGDAKEITAEHIVFDCTARVVGGANPAPAASTAPVAGSRIGDAGNADPKVDPASRGGIGSLSDVAFESEARAILAALEQNGGHRARTALSLGISERTLRYRLASMREGGMVLSGSAA